MRARLLPCLAALAALSAAGCLDDGTATVAIRGGQFLPQETTIQAGTTVEWTNEDHHPHDVAGDQMAWASPGGAGGLAKGETFAHTFDEPGTYEYYCRMHSPGPGRGMWGRIVVT